MVPRCLFADRTYLVTRRCSERRFYLRPSKSTNKIVRYAIAKASRIWGVEVHAWTIMSNHLHMVVTDRYRELPNFMRDLLLQISKAVGAEIGHWDGIWDPKRYSAVELLDEQAIVDAIAYVLANPVSAGLVRRARRWPGETSVSMAFGDTVLAARPDTEYFRNSTQPASFELCLEPPPGLDPIECGMKIRAKIREIENQAAERLQREGRRFLGEHRVLAQDPYDSATSWEKRRGLNPTYASKDKWKRVEAAQRRRDFLLAYREALLRYRNRDREVIFPHGTWLMERQHGCNCAPAPT